MALQGTLETFSMPEVLRLLSGTRKTGLLALEGDRGNGSVWMDEGRIVSARSDHESAGAVPAVLFDLLRFRSGAFVFETDARPDGDVVDVDVEEALTEAEALLEDWHEIESVVPSLKVWVSMVPTISGSSVSVTAEQWAALAVIGRGTSGERVADELELGELETSRRIHDLATAGFVEIDPTTATDEVEAADEEGQRFDADADPVAEVELEGGTWTQQDDLSVGLAGFVARSSQEESDDLVDLELGDTDDNGVVDEFDDLDEPDIDPAVELPVEADAEWQATDDFGDDAADHEDEAADHEGDVAAESAPLDDTGEPDEFLSQLANLSPKAAAAIEATASEDETAQGGARQSGGDGDEEINRNLLLKFLSSSKP